MKNVHNIFLEQHSHRKTPSLLVKLDHLYSLTQIMEILNPLNGAIQEIIKPDNENQKSIYLFSHRPS
ncbi:MAG: hypothetical protein ACI9SD_001722 [Pseudohongiellaceae bacterium]|jgi:hypothetical protein